MAADLWEMQENQWVSEILINKRELIDVSKCLSYTVPVIWTDFRQD